MFRTPYLEHLTWRTKMDSLSLAATMEYMCCIAATDLPSGHFCRMLHAQRAGLGNCKLLKKVAIWPVASIAVPHGGKHGMSATRKPLGGFFFKACARTGD